MYTGIILEVELDLTKQELYSHQETKHYQRTHYSVSCLNSEVIRIETGLPTKKVFNIVLEYAAYFKETVCYYAGWKVELISFEDQIFITVMKLHQRYTNLHLAQLFSCSVATVSNKVITLIHLLHGLLFDDLMTTIPSRDKSSFVTLRWKTGKKAMTRARYFNTQNKGKFFLHASSVSQHTAH